jgi:signal peptide peptidase SppA
VRLPFVKSRPIVSVVRLFGVIGGAARLRGGLSSAALAPVLERAFRSGGTRAVALDINSPGGSPVQSAMIFRRIRSLADEHRVPVFAFAQDVAASGGYWLALAADRIYADANSIVGSIGVISGSFGVQDWLARHGIERRMYTAGERKSFLDPFLPEKAEDVARLKVLQEDMHRSFIEVVRERRQGRLKGDDTTLFSGEFWTGRRALDLGLVDGLGDVTATMKAEFGERTRFRVFGGETSWWRRRLGLAGPGALAEELLDAVESRLVWGRYGL